MSAPQTNLERQRKRHRAPLVGMAVVAVFGVGLIVYWLTDEVSSASDNGVPEAATQGADVPPAQTAPSP